MVVEVLHTKDMLTIKVDNFLFASV